MAEPSTNTRLGVTTMEMDGLADKTLETRQSVLLATLVMVPAEALLKTALRRKG